MSSNGFTTCAPSIHLPTVRLVNPLCIALAKVTPPNTSLRLTSCGLGFGISIPTLSVPGIGAKILRDFVLRARARSFWRFSILEILIPACGLILICMTVGHTFTHSISSSISNSRSLFLIFSAREILFSSNVTINTNGVPPQSGMVPAVSHVMVVPSALALLARLQ